MTGEKRAPSENIPSNIPSIPSKWAHNLWHIFLIAKALASLLLKLNRSWSLPGLQDSCAGGLHWRDAFSCKGRVIFIR